MLQLTTRCAIASLLFASTTFASDFVLNEDVRLVPSALSGGGNAGHGVAIDGDTLAIGAHLFPGGGAVFVYRKVGGVWTEEATLIGSQTDNNDAFGYDLDLDGNRLVVGAADGEVGGVFRRGEAYIFERTAGVWSQKKRLVASNGAQGDAFGTDVAVDGDTVVVGAYGTNGWRGSAYVFEKQGGSWIETQELAPSHGGTNQLFGQSVDISGDGIAVGSPWMNLPDPASSDRPGAAYVFRHNGSSWIEEEAMAGFGIPFGGPQWMGESIAIDGDTLVAGGPYTSGSNGGANVFERVAGVWSQTAVLTSALGGGWSGAQLDLQGDWIALGAPLAHPDGDLQLGSVSLWQRQGSTWAERRELVPASMVGEGQMGFGVSLDGNQVLSGALYEGLQGAYEGAAYLFTIPESVGETFCFGDGNGTECPCGWNNFTPGSSGCLAGGVGKGGFLLGFGSASVGADDMKLAATNLPAIRPALLFHGSSELAGGNGVAFGNGLRCVGGTVGRVSVRTTNSFGDVFWPTGLAASEGFSSGDTALFQVWYRDPVHFCGADFNFTNGYRVSFTD